MSSLLKNLSIPIEVVTNGASIILLGISPYYRYEDGKRTENLEGYRYTVVEDKTYEKFSVKISSATPIITQDQIDNAKQKICISFENGVGKVYRTQSGEYDISFSASGISLVK